MKLQQWERGGFIIYIKRLESGCTIRKIFIKEGHGFLLFRWDELVFLIDGISPKKSRKR